MSNLILYVLILLGGATVAIQPSINARLAQKTGLIESATISFAVGTLALFLVSLLAGKGQLKAVFQARGWELSGGLLGAFFVTMTILSVPRIGTAATMALTIAAQLCTAMVLDHYGFLGMKMADFDLSRALGVVLLAVGVLLIVRR